MAYSYNESGISYSSPLSTYDGTPKFLAVEVFDLTSLSEFWQFGEAQTQIEVFDSLELSGETIFEYSNGEISLSDQAEISENVVMAGQLGDVIVLEEITITDSPTSLSLGEIGFSVVDEVETSETLGVTEILSFFVADEISCSEEITTDNYQLGYIYVSDELWAVGEMITIVYDFYNLGVSAVEEIFVSDSASVAGLEEFNTDVSDEVSLSESAIADLGFGEMPSWELVYLLENVTVELGTGEISITDDLSISEEAQEEALLGDIYVVDSVQISEETNQEKTVLIEVSVEEFVLILEETTEFLPEDKTVTVFDSLGLSEEVSGDCQFFISTPETLLIFENVSTENATLGGINVFDSFSILADFVTVVFDRYTYGISVNDPLKITESTEVQMAQNLAITVIDTTNLSDILQEKVFLGEVRIVESVNLSEYLLVDNHQLGNISKVENVTIRQVVTRVLFLEPHLTDTLGSTEQIGMESFQFSGSDFRPVGKGNRPQHVGRVSGYF